MERACSTLTGLRLTAWAVLALLVCLCSPGSGQDVPKEPEKPAPAQEPGQKKEPQKTADAQNTGGEEKKEEAGKQEQDKAQEKQEPGKDESKTPGFTAEQVERAYPVGEKLTYDVSWKGIHAGTAVLEVCDKVKYKGRECFRIRSYTTSAKAVSLVYKVDDRLQTYVDAETLEPLRSDKRLREGSHKRDEYVIYSPSDRTADYYKKKDGKFVLRRQHKEVPAGIQGALSSIYFLRSMKLEHGKSYEMKVLSGRQITTGKFEVAERKVIDIPGVGKFIGLRIAPKYIEVPGEGKLEPGEGLFVASGDSEVWVDEKTGMPLVMYVDIPLGSIRVQLAKREMMKKQEKGK
jgi:hypothetical protein